MTNAAVSFTLSTDLPSANNPYQLEFDYKEDILDRNRIAVLIGRNGSGKTQLLLSIIRAHRQIEDTSPAPQTTFNPPPSFNRLMVFSSVASDPYPRSIPPWHGLDYQYFSMIANQPGEHDRFTGALIDCLRDDGKIRFFDAPSPFARTGRMALLERSLASLKLTSGIYLPLKLQWPVHDFPGIRTWNGRAYFPLFTGLNEKRQLLLVRAVDWSQSPVTFGLGDEPRSLSSGELAMLRFAAQAVGSIEQGCLLLFDEPETHLHPNFISDFMSILHSILAATKSIAIIVTHSAYVVREVPRQRVRILTLENRNISINEPRFQTFGASIDGISQFIFGDSDILHRYQVALEEWLNKLGPDITIEEIISEYGDSLNPETLSYVAQLIRSRAQ